MAIAPEKRHDPIYEGSRIPQPIPSVLQVPEELRRSDDILEINFGPNHPSTHGVLRLVVELDGEKVVGLRAVVGYLHTGFEKSMEQKTWWKAIPYAPRMDYLSFQANELAFVMAIEKLLGIEVPPKATWMRMLLCELNRIHSHLVWLGTSALELGAISPFWYTFRERDRVLDLFEMVGGARMHTRYFQVGGLAEDIPRGFFDECRKFCEVMPKAVDEYEAAAHDNEIWLKRTKGVGLLSADDAIALGQSGPVLRGSGVDWDLRKAQPYLAYDQVDFDVPVYQNGDVYDRYKVHMDEMRESTRIVEQALEGMPGGPWIADDRKVVLPPREELHTSMESLIHHFKIVTEGYRVPEGEVYFVVESPARRVRLLRLLGRRPEAVARPLPGSQLRRARRRPRRCMRDALVADMIAVVGSLDTVMGEVRPVSELRRPDPGGRGAATRTRRSAILPALRTRAGAPRGWLPPEAFVEVADALDLTPAYCQAVASFYDMFHLEPVGQAHGRGVHQPLLRPRGAQHVVEAFESELGVRAGETTEDGQVTFRAVECLGGCGYAPGRRDRRPLPPSRRRRGRARRSWRSSVPTRELLLAGADERDLTKLAEYRADRRLRGAARRRGP